MIHHSHIRRAKEGAATMNLGADRDRTTPVATPGAPQSAQGERTVRIGNASGFYGDRLSGFDEMVAAGVDVITGDYLAELTMLILARQKAKDPLAGYAKTFITQLSGSLEQVASAGTRVVVNAGGMNPGGLATALRELAASRDLEIPIAYVDGDDLTDRADELGLGTPLAANAYLGGWGITEALRHGAQVVVTGRVTDAAVITGSAAWFHGWGRDDYDKLAGAMAAGHVIECGMQATGGNFSFFTELSDMRRPGFPIAEIDQNGDSVITKPAGTGGSVTVETVLSQLLYEVAGARYPGPDATLRLDSLRLADAGADRVRITGARGEAPPPDLKVSVTEVGGYRQQITFPLVGLHIPEKAELITQQFEYGLKQSELRHPASLEWTLARTDHPDADSEEAASARLTLVARDKDPRVVGRAFANIAVEFALGSIPGFFTDGPPGDASVYGRFRPAFVSQQTPPHTVHFHDGGSAAIAPPAEFRDLDGTALDSHSIGWSAGDRARPQTARAGETTVALGELFGARSGDKGGTANVGVWARSDAGWDWLRSELTADRLRELLPEAAAHDITRVELAGLRAVNFVIDGLLGEGVAFGARFDPQAKGLGEWLRARNVSVPSILAAERGQQPMPSPAPRPPFTSRDAENAQ